MSEELHMTKLLIKHVDAIMVDVTDIKVGLGKVATMLEVHNNRQDDHDKRLTTLENAHATAKGWVGASMAMGTIGVIGWLKSLFNA